MKFNLPTAIAEANANALRYLTKRLSSPESGRNAFSHILEELGHVIDEFPDWHPILAVPSQSCRQFSSLHDLPAYTGVDHTVLFARGFVTCPYSEDHANLLVDSVNKETGLHAYRLDTALYSDEAYPVVVQALEVELEGDGSIRGRDALAWCVQDLVRHAHSAVVAETWWNLRGNLLGRPHGSHSSILVNEHTGLHMRKILETLNDSGMFGEIKEWSLDMLSRKKRETISKTLLNAALCAQGDEGENFTFELRGELCKANIRDTWGDNTELSIRVDIGDFDLCVSGFFYSDREVLEVVSLKGKRLLAEKFL